MSKKRVLVLCTGNSARSQMAEGLVNALKSDQWEAFSAGTAPSATVHPFAVEAMREVGIDISEQVPKPIDWFRDAHFDLVITVCDDAASNCPVWLGRGQTVHIGFPDPAAETGSEEETLAAFREVRDGLRKRILSFLEGWKAGDRPFGGLYATRDV